MAFACAECEVFDVEAEIDREPLAVRPRVIRAINDRRVSITIVIGELHEGFLRNKRDATAVEWLMGLAGPAQPLRLGGVDLKRDGAAVGAGLRKTAGGEPDARLSCASPHAIRHRAAWLVREHRHHLDD